MNVEKTGKAQQVPSRDSWDEYFMGLAEESATRSKDPKTQVGSCIVKDKRVLSLGYNGAPRNFPDDEVPKENNKENILLSKNAFMCHSELNAILNYRGSLEDLNGATIYVTLSPCHECVKALIQVGIKEIVYRDKYHHNDIFDLATLLAEKCNVIYRRLKVK